MHRGHNRPTKLSSPTPTPPTCPPKRHRQETYEGRSVTQGGVSPRETSRAQSPCSNKTRCRSHIFRCLCRCFCEAEEGWAGCSAAILSLVLRAWWCSGRSGAPCSARSKGPPSCPVTHLAFTGCALPEAALLRICTALATPHGLKSVNLGGNAALFADRRTELLRSIAQHGPPLQLRLAVPKSGERVQTFPLERVMCVSSDMRHDRAAFLLSNGNVQIHQVSAGVPYVQHCKSEPPKPVGGGGSSEPTTGRR